MSEITVIRAAAKRLAAAHLESITRASALQTALSAAIKPIYLAHQAGIDVAAEEESSAKADLLALVDAAPQLFKRPRSITVDGVKCGYRKDDDRLDWDDEANVIARILALPELKQMAQVLVRTEQALNIGALSELTGDQRRQVGVRRIDGVDQSFITIGDSDVDKVMKALLADAAKRLGDDEPAKKKGKAKATVKEAA